jgi:uncharacterized RDD family membrane protein YckC
MHNEERYAIETPENVELTFDLAGPGSRFCALAVDVMLMWLFVFAIAIAGGIAGFFDAFDTSSDSGDGWATWFSAAMIVIIALVLFGYGFFFEWLLHGQTPGKRSLKLRVLRDDGTPATVVDLAIRNLVRTVDFLPGFYAVGGLVALLSAQQKRLGDMAAGTIVVKEAEFDYRAMVDKKRKVVDEPIAIGNHALSPEELRLVRGFLQRREELLPEARARLADDMGRRLHAKHGGQFGDGESYLLNLAEGRHFEP